MLKNLNLKFAAFIITFERPEILLETIDRILNQSCPPQKILIIDNSFSKTTEILLKKVIDPRIEYYSTGYNAGPAGGAKIGLERLAAQGYEWIYWGDDNDPPAFENCFERLLYLAYTNAEKCGQVGAVGQLLDKNKGILKRFETEYLRQKNTVEVDNIGGGMCKIVNSEIIKQGILPDEKKFFGFEELDFDLRCKNAGYSLLVDCSLFLKYREKSNRLNFKRKLGRKVKEENLWREYYSTRNLLSIFWEQNMHKAFLLLILRKSYKSFAGFTYGLSYGVKNFNILFKGLHHGLIGKKGFINKQDLF
ncbi:glycosyltransferase [Pontibacter virosus]|uniref:GT2 family glycosyltransferase n=1 Tax=Pontibacter virosus TaxID=1765052 RepID=A0A2U1B3B8_9BACT|nr:glycosyltransferase [Pontibacter virosus]PVY43027.1 GT2 family glycosyltransferase [Pontibacter virosus]